MSMSNLERALSRGLAPVWILWGDAGPVLDEAVGRIAGAALATIRLPALNRASYRAGDGDPAEPFVAARTLPMMDPLRLVVIRDIEEGSPDFYAKFLDYAGDPASTAVVVAVGTGFPRSESKQAPWPERLADRLGKRGVLQSFLARDVRPVEFATARAASRGKKLDADAARLLVELVGSDPALLASEVDKLVLFAGDAQAIDAAAVGEATSQVALAEVWDLTSALVVRDRNHAITALSRLLDAGEDSRRLLSTLAWQWRELLRFAELVRAGASDATIQREVRLRPEFQRAVRARLGKDFPGAAAALGRLATAWEDMNGHKAGDRRILEGLVLELLG